MNGMNYDQYNKKANDAWNNQFNQAQQNQAQAQDTYNKSQDLYNKSQGQDQNEYNDSRNATKDTASQQSDLNKTIGGQQALDAFNAQQKSQQEQAGFNADLNRNAMQNANQAVGSTSAYNDLLNTSGYNFGQNAGARAAAEAGAMQGINNNIAAQQNVLQGQQGAYVNSANVANMATNAMLAGQQNQIQNLANTSNTNLGLLGQANNKYNTDLQAWLGGVNSASGLYGQASNAIGTGAGAVSNLMSAESADANARILTPAQADAARASAQLSRAQAAYTYTQNEAARFQLEVSKRNEAIKDSNNKALGPVIERAARTAASDQRAADASKNDSFLGIFNTGHNEAAARANASASELRNLVGNFGGNLNGLNPEVMKTLGYATGTNYGGQADFMNTIGSGLGAVGGLLAGRWLF